MPRTWFVADVEGLVGAPVAAGDSVVPLDAYVQAELGSGAAALPDLRAWEAAALPRVLRDLGALAAALAADPAAAPWLSHDGLDLAAALRKPADALLAFPRQELAARVAREVGAGEAVAVGATASQLEGLEAALGSAPAVWPARARETQPPARSSLRLPPLLGERGRPAEVLYLALEPHVVLQQDRVLAALARRHTLAVALPVREPWPWPPAASFQPPEVLLLHRFLDPARLGRLALARLRRRGTAAPSQARPAWMPQRTFRAWLKQEWWRAAAYAEGLGAALAAVRPRLLVATNLLAGSGRLTAAVCARAGVRALGLPSGADLFAPPVVSAGDVGEATYVVAGAALREHLVAEGADGRRLLPLGLPETDATLADAPALPRAALMARHGLSPERPLVTFFSSPSERSERLLFPPEAKRRALESLVACREELGFELLVKLHPREKDDTLARWIEKERLAVPVCRDALADVLHASAVAASLGSAVTFAALLLGKPALVLDFGRAPLLTGVFRATGAGLFPGAPGEVPGLLRAALQGGSAPAREAFLRDWLAGGAPGVAERIVAAAEELLGQEGLG